MHFRLAFLAKNNRRKSILAIFNAKPTSKTRITICSDKTFPAQDKTARGL